VAIGNAIERRRIRRTIHQDKIGRDILVAYDESKRMLALCASTKVVSICPLVVPSILTLGNSSNSTYLSLTKTLAHSKLGGILSI
jgi:hypothetical protein